MSELPVSVVLLAVIMGLIAFIIYRIDCHREREMSWILNSIKTERNIKKHFNFDTELNTETATSMSEFSDFTDMESVYM
jgi:hypothetical protein